MPTAPRSSPPAIIEHYRARPVAQALVPGTPACRVETSGLRIRSGRLNPLLRQSTKRRDESRRGRLRVCATTQLDQFGLELATNDRIHAERLQVGSVQRRIQSEATKTRLGIDALYPPDHRHRQARRGVHRQVERDQVRFMNRGLGKAVDGEIDASDIVPRSLEPRRGRRQPKWLAAELVRRDEDGLHTSITAGSVGCRASQTTKNDRLRHIGNGNVSPISGHTVG